MKNVDSTMMGICMLGNYKESWESLKSFGRPEGPNKPKLPIKVRGKSPKKVNKNIEPFDMTISITDPPTYKATNDHKILSKTEI